MTANGSDQKSNIRFAAELKRYREDAGLTQADLARMTGVKREYISSIELGRIQVVYPDAFNALRHALQFPAFELLEAMGFQTDASEQGVLPALLVLLRSLGEAQQQGVLTIVKSIHGATNGAA